VYFLTVFYALSFVVIVARLVFASYQTFYAINKGYDSDDISKLLIADQADLLATFCTACLGIFQLASVLELEYMIRQNINKMQRLKISDAKMNL